MCLDWWISQRFLRRGSCSAPAMISLSLGSRLTVQGRKVRRSRAVRTGVRDDRKTSKLRTSPSISSSGSTSLVVGMFLVTLNGRRQSRASERLHPPPATPPPPNPPLSWPLVDSLEGGLVGDPVCLLQVEEQPGGAVGPLLRQVDPRRQPVPVEGDLISSQQAACGREEWWPWCV